jgi:tripartite-type tricarboxylate transporter receptor subunit TctC
MAPARVPEKIITKLNTVIVKGTQTGDVKEAFNKIGLETQTHTPKEFAELIRAELVKNKSLVAQAGIKAQ